MKRMFKLFSGNNHFFFSFHICELKKQMVKANKWVCAITKVKATSPQNVWMIDKSDDHASSLGLMESVPGDPVTD